MTIKEKNAPVPENIERVIQQKGLVKMAIAERAGLSQQQLCDMLNGRKIIKPCDVLAISDAIGVSVGDLFVDTGQSSA